MLIIIIIIVIVIGLYYRSKNKNDTWSDVNIPGNGQQTVAGNGGQIINNNRQGQAGMNGQNTPPTTPYQSQMQTEQPSRKENAINKAESAINNAKGDMPQLRDMGLSLRNEEGYACACKKCGTKVIGYGRAGGFCPICKTWSYDAGMLNDYVEKYGPKSYSAFTLMAYDQSNVNVRMDGKSGAFTMCVTPRSIILRSEYGVCTDIQFEKILSMTASKGVSQQLTIVYKIGEGSSDMKSISIDLKGATFDGAGGEDLLRIKQLYSGG